jgi:hypothetical protein
MANSTRKLVATAAISFVRELPGAVFFGDAMDADAFDYAARLQRIRASYENDDCQEMLGHDLSQLGFGPRRTTNYKFPPWVIFRHRLA